MKNSNDQKEQEKQDYLKNTTLKQMLWDTNQLLYWINENTKELTSTINNAQNGNQNS